MLIAVLVIATDATLRPPTRRALRIGLALVMLAWTGAMTCLPRLRWVRKPKVAASNLILQGIGTDEIIHHLEGEADPDGHGEQQAKPGATPQ